MAGSDALSIALGDLLEAAVEILGPNVPPRAFVAASTPPMQCPMLVTHLTGIGIAPSANQVTASRGEGRRKTIVYVASMAVTITRCAPQPGQMGTDPSPAEYTAFANALLQDVNELYSGLWQRMRHGQLFAGCRHKLLRDAQPIEEAGGQAGWLIPVEVDVDGINA